MAKSKYENEAQQEEMAVVIFRLKGGAGTLQKGFDTITEAIAAFGPQGRTNMARVTAKELAPANGNAAAEIEDAEIKDIEPDDEAAAAARPSAGRPRGPRKYNFLPDMDLTGNGVSFKEFATQKNPQTEGEKHLVAALWMHQHGGLETFTIHNVFTCFRTMDWNTAGDFGQPMRLMKKDRSYYSTPKFGLWKLTATPGMDAAKAIGNQ